MIQGSPFVFIQGAQLAAFVLCNSVALAAAAACEGIRAVLGCVLCAAFSFLLKAPTKSRQEKCVLAQMQYSLVQNQ